MIVVLFILLASVIVSIVAFIAYKKQNNSPRIMREGKLLKSEMVSINGEQLYVEKVRFKWMP